MADEDFEEEEVWSVVKERKDGSPKSSRRAKEHNSLFSFSSSSSKSSSKRVIPRSNGNVEGNGKNRGKSAPMDIPDWSKIYRYGSNGNANEINGNEDDDDDDRAPPHELLAKKQAGSQISSSVCEGAGRTLKGRDQRKVRNAVLTRTGFLE